MDYGEENIWTNGLCCVLANALRERFDLPMGAYVIRSHFDDRKIIVHAFGRMPDGRIVDGEGIRSEQEMLSVWDDVTEDQWRETAGLDLGGYANHGLSLEYMNVELGHLWLMSPEDVDDTSRAHEFIDSNPDLFGALFSLKLDQVMESYCEQFRGSFGAQHKDLTETLLEEIRKIREQIRADEGGGGMCHLVTEFLEAERGWKRLTVSRISPSGDVICAAHYVSVLADGTIVDPTADQFGDGHDIRILKPGDAGYGEYRPEFNCDYNPEIYPEELSGWAEYWAGEEDYDAQDRLAEERGVAWWLEDTQAFVAYNLEQAELARAAGGEWNLKYARRMEALAAGAGQSRMQEPQPSF